MFPNPCEDFFREHAENPQKVKALQLISEALNWQKLCASTHSPAVIDDAETLCRQVPDPTFVDALTGVPKPALFDDINNKGMSVDRLAHSPIEQIAERAIKRFDGQGRKLHSIVHLSAKSLRSLLAEGDTPVIGVYDTALQENTAHADVCVVVKSKQAFRSARAGLYELSKAPGSLQMYDK